MSRSTCPDCNRWRCVCLAFEEGDGGAEPQPECFPLLDPNVPEGGSRYPDSGCFKPGCPAHGGPPPAYVRTALAGLRAEFAERAARRARTYGRP